MFGEPRPKLGECGAVGSRQELLIWVYVRGPSVEDGAVRETPQHRANTLCVEVRDGLAVFLPGRYPASNHVLDPRKKFVAKSVPYGRGSGPRVMCVCDHPMAGVVGSEGINEELFTEES